MTTPIKSKYSVYLGSIIIHIKWRDTELERDLKAMFNSVCRKDIGPYDFCLNCGKYVIYIPESDLVSCIKQEKYRNINKNDTIIIAVRNTITAEQYSLLQDLLVIGDGKKVLPVGGSSEIPEILYQLSFMDSTPEKLRSTENFPVHINLLLNIPGLGKLKAERLLNTFGTINRIASSSFSELTSILGLNLAGEVYKYFN